MNEVDHSKFWEDIYLENDTGWDLKGVTPVFDSISNELIQGQVCIVGCGRGYDAIMFAKKGFDVTAVDFAPTPISELNKYFFFSGKIP
jgi:2-polyprenyl-3-methyl-5-hydroxy-6-metoxy-1,4-benzoquinol methylase